MNATGKRLFYEGLVASLAPMSLGVSRILHAGYLFECEGARVAFDPIFENPFSGNCFAFPEIEFERDAIRKLRLDAVFISHFHDDHCSLESLALLPRETPIYIYCLHEELLEMIRTLGFRHVTALELGAPVRVGPLEVIPRRALDADVDSIFHIRTESLNILNVVDSWIDDATLRLLSREKWDLVLWPFQTMRELEVLAPSFAEPAPAGLPAEWIEQLRILKPRLLVPSSCQFRMEKGSWYNRSFFPVSYRLFENEMRRHFADLEILRLDPGESIVLHPYSFERSARLKWVRPVGDQKADYEYDAHNPVPPTAEIARGLLALDPAEERAALDYCETGILERYAGLEESFEPYFQTRRTWRLSVFDSNGRAREFFYVLEPRSIRKAAATPDADWTTEIPLRKLYGALHEGETLTSLYLRVNSAGFSAERKEFIKAVEVTEDPLIRCLFTGVFGAYQRAQLRRLNGR